MVLRAGDAPQSLADNLTEILIAAVSQLDRFEIVGKEEFQTILGVTSRRSSLQRSPSSTASRSSARRSSRRSSA